MSGATTAAAVVGAGVIGGAATAYGANQAASAQRNASAQATAAEENMFNQAASYNQPFINTGQAAASKISDLEGLNGGTPSTIMSTLQSLPGYQFANEQGLKSVQNSAAARGLAVSGAADKGAANFSTGLANQYYDNYLTGLQNTENTGAQSAQSLGTNAVNTGAQIGSNDIGAGNATAASDIATGSAVSGVGNSLVAGQLLQANANSNGGSNNWYAPTTNNALTAPTATSQGYTNIGEDLNSQFTIPGSSSF